MADERRVHDLFSIVFSTDSALVMHEAIKGLREEGLSERQIENGIIAGSLQLQIDLGHTLNVTEICRGIEDGELIKNSLLPVK